MSNKTKNVTVQFPIFGLLGLIFVTLKLTGHITWSWLWVLSPFWLPFAIFLGLAAIVFIVAFLIDIFSRK
jgi:uncharacterized protein (DUF983 family)